MEALASVQKWISATWQPEWASIAERARCGWHRLRSPWTWVCFDKVDGCWVEGKEKRQCPRPDDLDIRWLRLDAPRIRAELQQGREPPRRFPLDGRLLGKSNQYRREYEERYLQAVARAIDAGREFQEPDIPVREGPEPRRWHAR